MIGTSIPVTDLQRRIRRELAAVPPATWTSAEHVQVLQVLEAISQDRANKLPANVVAFRGRRA